MKVMFTDKNSLNNTIEFIEEYAFDDTIDDTVSTNASLLLYKLKYIASSCKEFEVTLTDEDLKILGEIQESIDEDDD